MLVHEKLHYTIIPGLFIIRYTKVGKQFERTNNVSHWRYRFEGYDVGPIWDRARDAWLYLETYAKNYGITQLKRRPIR